MIANGNNGAVDENTTKIKDKGSYDNNLEKETEIKDRLYGGTKGNHQNGIEYLINEIYADHIQEFEERNRFSKATLILEENSNNNQKKIFHLNYGYKKRKQI